MSILSGFQRLSLAAALGLLIVLLTAESLISMQSGDEVTIAKTSDPKSKSTSAKAKPVTKEAKKDKENKAPQSFLNENAQEIEREKITSFFVRENDSKRIQLSMLVAYRLELATAVREVIGEKVTPLVFSVSTLPNRSGEFDPALLQFEQHGRAWKPSTDENAIDILSLNEKENFGGRIENGEVHQGIVLLPAWFNPQVSITVRYGDFHYLAKFADGKH